MIKRPLASKSRRVLDMTNIAGHENWNCGKYQSHLLRILQPFPLLSWPLELEGDLLYVNDEKELIASSYYYLQTLYHDFHPHKRSSYMTKGIIVLEGWREEKTSQLLMSICLNDWTPIINKLVRYIQQESTKKENTITCGQVIKTHHKLKTIHSCLNK